MERGKSIIQLLGSLLLILSGLLLVPFSVALVYGDGETIYLAFIFTALLSLGLGLFFLFITRKHVSKLDLATSMILCSVSWLVLSLVGAMPFILGLNKSFMDAFFESVSGFTTTGITVFQGLDEMPYGILFWRSFIQWLGGLGILTFFLFITANAEGDLWNLFGAEAHKINSSRPVPNVFRTIQYFWAIYAGLTSIEAIILKLLGLDFFEAVIHALSTLSTGGFSNHDASIAYYHLAAFKHYRLIDYTIIIFMFLGGINFLIHYRMIKEDRLALFKDVEAKVYMKIIGFFSLISLAGIWMMKGLSWLSDLGLAGFEETLRTILFQIVSVITSTGFGTEDIGSDFFPAVTKQLFIILMIVGGCVGSTAGGLKVLRLIVMQKLLKREVNKLTLPGHAVLPVTVGKVKVDQQEVLRITAIVFGWFLLIAIGSAITAMFSDLGPFEAFSGMTSAVGNMGPFYFSVAKMASLSWVVKSTFILGMLAGRLELLPIYVLLVKRAWR